MIARARLIRIIRKIEKSLEKVSRQRELFISLNILNAYQHFTGIIKLLKEEREYYQRQLNKLID